ncbi:hypothetical protein KKB18_04785, partial [bacterium]|nr:hypothetical protein [bacterium]
MKYLTFSAILVFSFINIATAQIVSHPHNPAVDVELALGKTDFVGSDILSLYINIKANSNAYCSFYLLIIEKGYHD